MPSRGLQKRQRGGSCDRGNEIIHGESCEAGLMAIPRMPHHQKYHGVIWQIVSNLSRKGESTESRESGLTDRLTSHHCRLTAILASTFPERAGTTIVGCDLAVLFRVVALALGS